MSRRFLHACLLSCLHEIGLTETASSLATEILHLLYGNQGSLPCLLELVTGPYPEAAESNPRPQTMFL